MKWNEYRGPYFTIMFGAGSLYEFDAHAQDQESKVQFRFANGERPRLSFPSERKASAQAGKINDLMRQVQLEGRHQIFSESHPASILRVTIHDLD